MKVDSNQPLIQNGGEGEGGERGGIKEMRIDTNRFAQLVQ